MRARGEPHARRVIVLGGYGTFGRRISERAAALGFHVIVAGRSLARAEAFCAGRQRLEPFVVDRNVDLAKSMQKHQPFAIVDAVGPFQGAGYETARAAMAVGAHYLDIADGSSFVRGITALDQEAKSAKVRVISGASSVPALSGAVVSRLHEGMDKVFAVDMAISASSKGTAGRSVTAAILSYIGRPVRLFRGGRWTHGWGWQEMRRRDFNIEGEPPLKYRLVSLADVPDLELLPPRLPGHPSVTFAAGTDAPWHNAALWLMSWLVRLRLLSRPERFADILASVQLWTRGPSSHRSAFDVRLFGKQADRVLERRWTLIANQAHGPEIPSMAVPILLEKLATGALSGAGASDAGQLLSLDDFQPSLKQLATVQALTERTMPRPLYYRVMGEKRYAELPEAVRRMHDLIAEKGASGEVTVTRGRNPLANLVASIIGFPAAGHHTVHVTFDERDGREKWTREFADGRFKFSSVLSEYKGQLIEQFGVMHFAFDLASDKGLRMEMRRWWIGPLRMPLFLAPRSVSTEWEQDGYFRFDVPISLPFLGKMVHYNGWLLPTHNTVCPSRNDTK